MAHNRVGNYIVAKKTASQTTQNCNKSLVAMVKNPKINCLLQFIADQLIRGTLAKLCEYGCGALVREMLVAVDRQDTC